MTEDHPAPPGHGARASQEDHRAASASRQTDALIARVDDWRGPQLAEVRALIRAADEIAANPKAAYHLHQRMKWYEGTVRRFEAQKAEPNPTCEAEIHVVRIGDAVICTNPFELFTDYGVQIKARSRAVQTFVIQLAGRGTYLPTERALRGGGYSAVVESNEVGPAGGQVLVDRTVEAIEAVFRAARSP